MNLNIFVLGYILKLPNVLNNFCCMKLNSKTGCNLAGMGIPKERYDVGILKRQKNGKFIELISEIV